MKSHSCLLFFLCSFFSIGLYAQSNPAHPTITGPVTSIIFDEMEFEFGEVEQGEKVRHVFTFTNTGNEPLIISNAKGSCGCTIPRWPMEPLSPGEQGEIEVLFDTKGKKGKQSKRITITANTDPVQTFLTVKGEVTAPTDAVAEKREDKAKNEKTIENHKNCISVYPNPTADVLSLDIKDHIGKSAVIEIFTDMGQTLERKVVDHISSDPITFDVRNYTPGMYLATIKVEGEQPVAKCFLVAGR